MMTIRTMAMSVAMATIIGGLCSDPTTNILLYVSAKETTANKSLAVRSVCLESDVSHTNALEVKSGTHRLVWDAGKDNPNFVGDAVTVEVQALLGTGLNLVIDLSGGKDAASYPISYLGALRTTRPTKNTYRHRSKSR